MDFGKALNEWVTRSNKVTYQPVKIFSTGPKYVKITWQNDSGVFAFIEKTTGDVLMPATWKAPAKHARGNIYKVGEEGVEKYGVKYLK